MEKKIVRNSCFTLAVLLIALFCVNFAYAEAQLPVGLGTATDFGVLAGSAISSTGPTVIAGNVGLSPGTALSGFPPGIVNGEISVADGVALQAQTDLTTAYLDAAGRTPALDAGLELGGQTLVPGVYKSDSSFMISSDMTLDAEGDPDAIFIFQAGSTLTTMSGTQILLINEADPCNIFWQVGSSATLGTNSVFKGTILALTSITLTTGADMEGRALARNGAVTLDSNNIYLTCVEIKPKLTVTKVVINDNGGINEVGDFPLFVNLTLVASGVENTFDSGSYIVSELGDSGYTSIISGDCAMLDGSITLNAGDVKQCTITNNDIYVAPARATLRVVKQVINDNSGAKLASDFTMLVTGVNPDMTNFSGDESGTFVTMDAGAYSVDETADSGYAKTLSADCSGTIAAGESKVCTITNNDIYVPPTPTKGTIQVIKHVINDDTGTYLASDFTMLVTGVNPDMTSFPGDESGTFVTMDAGAYSVNEDDPGLLGYTKTLSADCSGTIAAGESKVCTITNNDIHTGGGGDNGGGPGGVPEFPVFGLALAVLLGGFGLAYLRKR